MYLKAISIGYAVPRTDFNATVHSVFESAINLRLARGSKLLTLVASSEADLPQGIRVDTPEDFSFEIFHAGEQMSCWDDILRLGCLTIELRDARRWKCDLSALQADTVQPTVSAAWSFVWDMLNKRQRLTKSEIVAEDLFRSDESVVRNSFRNQRQYKYRATKSSWLMQFWQSNTIQAGVPGKAGEAMRGLFNATQRFDPTVISLVRPLIGLGPGLTPSGDDLLVGYLAGLWCSALDKSERVQFVTSLGKAVIRLSRQTNDISRTYLLHAARGQVSSRLADLAEAICNGENSDRLLTAAESAMQVGHTSGMDAVTGLLIGLTTWISTGTACH